MSGLICAAEGGRGGVSTQGVSAGSARCWITYTPGCKPSRHHHDSIFTGHRRRHRHPPLSRRESHRLPSTTVSRSPSFHRHPSTISLCCLEALRWFFFSWSGYIVPFFPDSDLDGGGLWRAWRLGGSIIIHGRRKRETGATRGNSTIDCRNSKALSPVNPADCGFVQVGLVACRFWVCVVSIGKCQWALGLSDWRRRPYYPLFDLLYCDKCE